MDLQVAAERWGRLTDDLVSRVFALIGIGLVFAAFWSLDGKPTKAIVFAVLALYFQRAHDWMEANKRRRERAVLTT